MEVRAMRAVRLLLALEIALFQRSFQGSTNLGDRVDRSRRAGAFECLGVATSLYLLSKSRLANASLADWLISLTAILRNGLGFIGLSTGPFAGFFCSSVVDTTST